MTTAEQVLDSPLGLQGNAPAHHAPRQKTPQTVALRPPAPTGIWPTGLLAAAAWVALGLLTLLWPNKEVGFND